MTIQIKQLIQNFLNKQSSEYRDKEGINKLITDNLSPGLVKYIKGIKVYRDKLIVYCQNATALYEFSLKKEGLLKEIQRVFPGIQQIRVKVKG